MVNRYVYQAPPIFVGIFYLLLVAWVVFCVVFLEDTGTVDPEKVKLRTLLGRASVDKQQTLRVEYDGTVRTSTGDIIQLKYGEDGVDPAKSDHGKAVNVSR